MGAACFILDKNQLLFMYYVTHNELKNIFKRYAVSFGDLFADCKENFDF